MKKCGFCGKEFGCKTNRDKDVFCSRACSQKNRRAIRKSRCLCVRCGNDVEDEQTRCIKCRVIHKVSYNKIKRKTRSSYYYKSKTKIESYEAKERFLELYGSYCCICGESHKELLTLDHVNGCGHQDRRNRANLTIYKDAIDKIDKTKYRVLCMNCNWSNRYNNNPFINEHIVGLLSLGG